MCREKFFSGYGFRKIESRKCQGQEYGEFSDITKAKVACKNDKKCDSIYDKGCGKPGLFYLCPANATSHSEQSCVHHKFFIGW